MTPRFDDYVDVTERIRMFYERFPEGSLRSGSEPALLEIGGKWFVTYHAQAFRTPDDPCPADGWAWEPVPGPTSFTKDSELMNAETSAWGRAIIALGFPTKKIASSDEVQARQPSTNGDATPVDVEAMVQQAARPSELPVHFGKNKGVLLGSLTPQQLGWYANQWQLQEDPTEYDHLLKTSAVALLAGEDGEFNVADDPFPEIPF